MPLSLLQQGFAAVVWAWARDPVRTRGTYLLPVGPDEPAMRRWLHGRHPRFELVRVYPVGAEILTYHGADGKTHQMPGKGIRTEHTLVRLGSPDFQGSVFRPPTQVQFDQRSDAEILAAAASAAGQPEPNVFPDKPAAPAEAAEEPPRAKFKYTEEVPAETRAEWGEYKLKAWAALSRLDYGKDWLKRQPELVEAWLRQDMPAPAADAPGWYWTASQRPPGRGNGRIRAATIAGWMHRVDGSQRELLEAALHCARFDLDFICKSARAEYFEVPNRPSCRKFRDRIVAECRFYEESGIWRRWDFSTDGRPHGLNPLLVAVRTPDDGKGRVCLASMLNDWFVVPPFRMPRAGQFLGASRPGFWFLRKDLSKAFYCWRLSPEAQRSACFVHPLRPGEVWTYTAPAFGLSPAPAALAILTRATMALFRAAMAEIATQLEAAADAAAFGSETAAADRALAAALREASVSAVGRRHDDEPVDVYADDYCATAEPLALAVIDFLMEMEGREAGLPFAPDKDVYGPSIIVLGAQLCAREGRMWLPARRAQAYAVVLDAVLVEYGGQARVPWRVVASIRGKLGFAVSVSRWLRWALESVDRALYMNNASAEWDGTCPAFADTDGQFWEDLRDFWLPLLRAAPHWLLSRSRFSLLPRARAIAESTGVSGSDASGKCGMGGVVGAAVLQRPLTDPELAQHIQVLEGRGSAAVLLQRLGIKLACTEAIISVAVPRSFAMNQRWFKEIDNVGAVSDWNKGGQHWASGGELRGELWAALLLERLLGLDSRAYHLPGTVIICLGHDDASREMRDDGVPLLPAAVPPQVAAETGAHSWPARALWNLIQLCGTSEVIQYVGGRLKRAWELVDSSDDEPAQLAAGSVERPDFTDSEEHLADHFVGRNEGIESSDSDGSDDEDELTFRDAARRIAEQFNTGQQAEARAALLMGIAPARCARAQRTPGACSVVCCRNAHLEIELLCANCQRSFHWVCLGIAGRKHKPVAWRCGTCVAEGREFLSSLLDGDAAAAFAATAGADSSDRTYTSSLKRFVTGLQLISRARGAEWSAVQLLPPAPEQQTPVIFALTFVYAAVGLLGSRAYSISAVRLSLRALTKWHEAKSGGAISGPANSTEVRAVVKALDKARKRSGVTVMQAFACPRSVMEFLAAFVSRMLEQLGSGPETWLVRYIWSRNWLRIEMAFLAVLRTNESIAANFGESFRAHPDPAARMVQLGVSGAKNHDELIWVDVPLQGPGELCFEHTLRRHASLIRERGIVVTALTPLFGIAHDPTQALLSAAVIFARPRSETVTAPAQKSWFFERLLEPALAALGRVDINIELKWAGYSFRRGGINEIYLTAKANGMKGLDLLAHLLRAGRWRSAASLYVYLVDVDTELAKYFQLIMTRAGVTLGPQCAAAAPDDDAELQFGQLQASSGGRSTGRGRGRGIGRGRSRGRGRG
jgi:hypothetical protein